MKTLLCVLFFSAYLNAQISPGDLTKAHEKLEGMSSCTKCHEIGEKVLNSKCLACHTEINELIRQKRGYHSGSDVKGKNCASCHNEHHGRNFRIINFNKDNFEHSKTGYILSGKHSRIACMECHNPKNIAAVRSKKTGWLGLSSACSSCHIDYHKGSLGNNCSSCHNSEKFRPAAFDHNTSKFPLTGSHQRVLCIKCHPINGQNFQKFNGVQFGSCSNCHKDVHSGKLGRDCKNCHNTNSFRLVNQGSFDHNKTNFPLKGKHLSVLCNSCHKNGFAEKFSYAKCTDCHKDYHSGQFKSDGVAADCSKCHDVNGFSPSRYSIDDHNKLEFQLKGSHLAVPCNSCHYKNDSWKFRDLGVLCSDCHRNIHGTEITPKYLEVEGCTNCHAVLSWSNIKFDHNQTKFPLLGKHAKLECRNCHVTKEKTHRFASLNINCTGCHNDVHAGQFGTGSSEECSRCHTPENWSPQKFDHNKTRFSLEGKHAQLKCSQCHKTVTENNISFIKYKVPDFKCASCHS